MRFSKLPILNFVFLGCFWAYLGQPHKHIGWVLSMPFASTILLTKGPIPEIFSKNIENWGNWRTQFFWVGHFGFFFKIFFFCFFPKYSNQFMGYQGWNEILIIALISWKMRNTVSLKRCIWRSNLLFILQACILQTLVDISHNPLKYFTEQVSYSEINHEAPDNSIMPRFFCLPIESWARR